MKYVVQMGSGAITYISSSIEGRAIAQAVSRRLPTTAARVEPRSGHMGFVVDKVALGQIFSQYFRFPCQFSFHQFLHTHHLPSGAATTGQLVEGVPSGLSLCPPQEKIVIKMGSRI
jgi:hypothetical protein